MTKFLVPVQQVLTAETCVCAFKVTGLHFRLELLENALCDDNLFLLNPFNFSLCVSVWIVQGSGTAV